MEKTVVLSVSLKLGELIKKEFPEEDKKRLSELTPEEYIGIAPKLVNLK